MSYSDASVTFLPSHTVASAVKGESLLDCALAHGIDLECECGGSCACTTCRVRVVSGQDYLSVAEAPERERLAIEGRTGNNIRLACQALVGCGNIVIDTQPDHCT